MKSVDSSIEDQSYRLANAAVSSGNVEMGLAIYERNVKRRPNDIAFRLRYADLLRISGYLHKSKKEFQEILALLNAKQGQVIFEGNAVTEERRNEIISQALTGMGRLSITRDEPRAATMFFLQAIGYWQHNFDAYNGLAVSYDLNGCHSNAIEIYKSLIETVPERPDPRINYGLSLVLSGEPELAIRELTQLPQREIESPKVMHTIAFAYVVLGEEEKSTAILSLQMPPQEVKGAIKHFRALKPVIASQGQACFAPSIDLREKELDSVEEESIKEQQYEQDFTRAWMISSVSFRTF